LFTAPGPRQTGLLNPAEDFAGQIRRFRL